MAKKAAKRGRKPLPEEQRLDHEMTIRFSTAEHLPLLEAAASVADKPVRVFVRDAAIEAARSVLGREA